MVVVLVGIEKGVGMAKSIRRSKCEWSRESLDKGMKMAKSLGRSKVEWNRQFRDV